MSRLCCLHQHPESLLSGASVPLSFTIKGRRFGSTLLDLQTLTQPTHPSYQHSNPINREKSVLSLCNADLTLHYFQMREQGGKGGGGEGTKHKALERDKRAEMQGRFYRLTVASEESAIRFHCCKTRRCAAAERAPGNSCAQM